MSENINEVINEEVTEEAEALEVTEAVENIKAAEAEEASDESPALERDEAYLALVRRKELFDKFTTALLILLMCAPFAILTYIIIWFLNP